jgi:hypothetical protein
MDLLIAALFDGLTSCLLCPLQPVAISRAKTAMMKDFVFIYFSVVLMQMFHFILARAKANLLGVFEDVEAVLLLDAVDE